ncbi:MAG TPA: carboxypeptidase-like regulatory domain-containing protein [Gemmatimonadaceae bacterium]|nr:carboxypeptidase-like regulatory domain-containing protein [Gemmatimonadaceae bacterium]
MTLHDRIRMLGAGLLFVASAMNAGAQQPVHPPLTINVRVVDSGAVAISGAEVAVVQGLNDARASGNTDVRGLVSLTISDPDGNYQIIVRKIGFVREAEFFHARSGPLNFQVVMHRAVQSLAPVQVNAQEDVTRKSYFIDADEIAKHADQLIDATDILKKLRPDMICGRSCFPMQAAGQATKTPVRKCPTLAFQPRRTCPVVSDPNPSLSTNVWVNGVWIRSIATDTVCQTGRRGILAGLSPGSMQVLCEIQPEHIEQITYADEFNTTVGKPHSDSAIYIVLKQGVAYQPGAKSYVVDESPEDSKKPAAARSAGGSHDSLGVASPHDSTAALPRYRYRLLGVFDEGTGDPVEGAHVTDAKSGDYVTTTATGTVSLVFLPEGSSLLKITKPGYQELDLTVDIGPNETNALTLLMKKTPEHR